MNMEQFKRDVTQDLEGDLCEALSRNSESDGCVQVDAELCQFDQNCKRCNGTGVVPAYHDAPAMCDCERDWQPPDDEYQRPESVGLAELLQELMDASAPYLKRKKMTPRNECDELNRAWAKCNAKLKHDEDQR